MLPKLASFCFRRRWIVMAVWLVALVGVSLVAGRVGDAYSTDLHLKGYDSQEAIDLLEDRFPEWAGLMGDIVFTSDAGVDDPWVKQQMTDYFEMARGLDKVISVHDPYGVMRELQVSESGKTAYGTIQFEAQTEPDIPVETIDALQQRAEELRDQGLQVELGGAVFLRNSPPQQAGMIGMLAAVVILIIAFGSVLAMGLPIGTALFGIGTALGGVSLISHITTVPDFSIELAMMIGIGVGIDYSLFIVTRYRSCLADGMEPERAAVMAIDTSGRAVLFAGLTVMFSLAGMLFIDIRFVQGLGVACAVMVGVTMVASLTMLPALLGFAGRRIDWLSIPGLGGRADADGKTIWYRWSRLIQKSPWPSLLVAFAFMLVVTYPVFSMRLGTADGRSAPTTDTTRRAYDLKAEGFGPGSNGPFLMSVSLPDSVDGSDLVELNTFLAPLRAQLEATPGVASVTAAMGNPEGDAAVFQLIPTTSAQEEATSHLLAHVRHDVLPPFMDETGAKIHVGGLTALFDDLADKVQSGLPVFIGVVLGLAFLLLMVTFRSILVPLKAVFLNLLSIGAAYGFIVIAFEWGWGGGLIGVRAGPIESFVPMMLFAILFGLSMDYEVFLLSRIKEEYDRTGDNSQAVADGLSATARVITAAAAIMVTVFGTFVMSETRVIKMFGLGLAVAVLLDATIVRMILVPATMELLGKANWWFPRWLEWLPQIHVEGRHDDAAGQDATAERAETASGQPSS